jgi:hypothetical protein
VSASPARTLDGATSGEHLGVTVAGLGDVNGDAYDDIAAGATHYRSGGDYFTGRAYVHHGSASGVSATAARTLTGTGYGSYFGRGLAGAGDVDADGYDDLLVAEYGAPSATFVGTVYVYRGSASGIGASALTSWSGTANNESFGLDVDGAGDVNGDGYADVILGGYGWTSSTGRALVHHGAGDEDGDGVYVGGDSATAQDCDDADNTVGAPSARHADADGDGHGEADATLVCSFEPGYVDDDTDCDDTRADVNPGATELCDAADTDEDCDGAADDADSSASAATKTTFWADDDGDTYGDAGAATSTCDLPAGHVTNDDDCDDTRADVRPSGTEICDAADTDEDCDGLADDADVGVSAGTKTTFWADDDGDTHGDIGAPRAACDLPSAHVTNDDDCDDGRADIHPGGAEVCDAADADEDCDGLADDADSSVSAASRSTFWADADADTYGDAAVSIAACDVPGGYIANDDDCDDGRADVHPGATEVCDAADTDEDCDGAADDADAGVSAATRTTSWADADGADPQQEADGGDGDDRRHEAPDQLTVADGTAGLGVRDEEPLVGAQEGGGGAVGAHRETTEEGVQAQARQPAVERRLAHRDLGEARSQHPGEQEARQDQRHDHRDAPGRERPEHDHGHEEVQGDTCQPDDALRGAAEGVQAVGPLGEVGRRPGEVVAHRQAGERLEELDPQAKLHLPAQAQQGGVQSDAHKPDADRQTRRRAEQPQPARGGGHQRRDIHHAAPEQGLQRRACADERERGREAEGRGGVGRPRGGPGGAPRALHAASPSRACVSAGTRAASNQPPRRPNPTGPVIHPSHWRAVNCMGCTRSSRSKARAPRHTRPAPGSITWTSPRFRRQATTKWAPLSSRRSTTSPGSAAASGSNTASGGSRTCRASKPSCRATRSNVSREVPSTLVWQTSRSRPYEAAIPWPWSSAASAAGPQSIPEVWITSGMSRRVVPIFDTRFTLARGARAGRAAARAPPRSRRSRPCRAPGGAHGRRP